MPSSETTSIRVWDLPTRIFHWAIVALFLGAWWSAKNGAMDWHYRCGLTLFALLVFRFIWGFIGGSTARFSGFVRWPVAVWRDVHRPRRERQVGHTVLGGYSVIAMLGALTAQVGTGAFAVDVDGLDSGPLSNLISFEAGRRFAELHEASFDILLALISLHLAAIAYHTLKGEKLVKRMITGRDSQPPGNSPELVPSSRGRLALAATLAIVATWMISRGLNP